MMKKTLLLLLGLALTAGIQAADFETASDAVKNMGVGWNLGNTLDANRQTITDITNAGYWGQQDLNSETCWGQYVTQPELLKMLKDAGFGAIRVPVTWYNHMDKDGKVDAAWMNRVKEVVGYVVENGLYCILNIHHDTGATGYDDKNNVTFYSWIKADESNYETNKAKFEGLWKQIAEEFKDYDEHLLFEGYNEMLDSYNSWCFASFATQSKYDESVAKAAYNAINNYAQSFVDVVRATGGNNVQRNLIVSTYAACSGGGTWSSHLQDPLKEMKLPTDNANNHLLFEVHAYPSIKGGLANAKSEVDQMFNDINTYLGAKAPVIIGEWGTANDIEKNKDDYDVRKDDKVNFAAYFVQQAKTKGFATYYWMGLTDGAARLFPAFSQTDLAKSILQAYHGSSFNPTLPVRSDYSNTCISATVNYTNQWGEFNLFSGSIKASDYSGIELELADKPESGLLQYKVYGTSEAYSAITDATSKLSFTNAMGTITRITLQCNKTSGKTTVKSIWLVKKDGTKIPSDPGVFWGCTMSDVKTTTGIYSLKMDLNTDGKTYNLQGQRVDHPQKGIYIKNGKKFIKK